MTSLVVTGLLILITAQGYNATAKVKVYEFQRTGVQSDSHLWYSGQPLTQPLRSVTVCARMKFFFLWEVSGFLQLSDDSSGTLIHTIQAEINLNYIRVTLGKFRRYHFLKERLRALTWHHLCVTFGNGVMISYLDGEEQDRHNGNLSDVITGTQLKVGSWDADKSYSGQLTQVNFWSRMLSADEVAAQANCEDTKEGDIVAWNGPWTAVGDVVASTESLEQLCADATGNDYYIFQDYTGPAAFKICKGLGGSVPTPKNEEQYQTIKTAIDTYEGAGGRICSPFWVGITDVENEGSWIQVTDNQRIHPKWSVAEPDGDILENCAVADGPRGFSDARCDDPNCVVCGVPRRPVWTLLGACERFNRNTHFIALQDENARFLFRGYSDYQIVKSEDTDKWIWWDWRKNETVASLPEPVNGAPIGRQTWKLLRPMCGVNAGQVRRLLLTPCGTGNFSCDDASCIPLFQRCDLKFDCKDKSDESGCQLVKFPPVYRPDLPPAINSNLKANESAPLPVSLYVIIESADVDTPSMHMHVNLNVSMTWQESRLNFLNLNEDYTLNRVPYETMKGIWVPVIDFTNTKGNHITQADTEATMVVNMLGKPSMGDNKEPEEYEVYAGPENPISVRRKYSITFQCQFDLKMYPFDVQYCHMELTMLSASNRLLVFDEAATDAIFEGNPNLVEYFVGNVAIEYLNDRDFAVMLVKLQLLRRSGFIIMNVYIPSLCLLVISYLTLYFTLTNFQVRVLASLTSLLVMATLFTQASSSLPKTSYFKMVDVWLLSSIFFIFLIIVVHTVVDRIREWELLPQALPSRSPPTRKGSISPTPLVKAADPTDDGAGSPEEKIPDVEETSPELRERHTIVLAVCQPTCPSDDCTSEGMPKKYIYEMIILVARILAFVILIFFNIVYWSLVSS
ncbi:LOW QUALITY PROTEIN: uncharacterized protein [Macrobrachium rosenbergii]|uniref:LOW QUALITY PROTEIN: uncharacterized protein n=1 Tax=Macrobrachium rosenbergii TaxID=79674 RepID=UPI0034D3C58D